MRRTENSVYLWRSIKDNRINTYCLLFLMEASYKFNKNVSGEVEMHI